MPAVASTRQAHGRLGRIVVGIEVSHVLGSSAREMEIST